jgi:anti-sigma B factor antagonist
MRQPDRQTPGGPTARFGIHDTVRDGVRIVHVTGELDLATAPQLQHVLDDRSAEAGAVVVDLSAVEFVDSSGLRLLVVELRRCESEGRRFAVVPGAGEARRVIELSGLATHLPLVEDLRQVEG